MSNYHVRRSSDEYLEHSWADVKRGAHKYIAKINVGGRVRYIYNQAQLAAARAGGAVSNARRSAGQFIDKNITGASARRGMNASRTRYNNLSSSGKAWARGGATRAKAAAQKYERSYNRSLAGRIANAGNAARKFVGQQANHARRAGQNFAGSIQKNAYKVGRTAVKTANNVAKTAKRTATNVRNNAQNAYEEGRYKLGLTYRDRMRNIDNYAKEGVFGGKTSNRYRTAYGNRQILKNKYDKSIAGRVENAGRFIGSLPKKANKAANNAMGKAKQRMADAQEKRENARRSANWRKKEGLEPYKGRASKNASQRGRQRHNQITAKRRKAGNRRNYVQ